MGRRRRFVLLEDDDDEEDVRIKFKPSGGSSSSGAKPRKSQSQPQQRRRVAADDDEDEDKEEVELEEEQDDDEKDLEAMRRAEEEERRVQEAETKTRRRRDPESEEVEPQEEEPREEENTEAVPVAVGDPVKITGEGRKQKKHYASFEFDGDTFELEDRVMLSPEDSSGKPYVVIVKDITETEGNLYVTGQWFYRPEEAAKKEGGCWIARDERELFYSYDIADVLAESVMHKIVVHFIPEDKQIPSRKQLPGFIVQKGYDAVEKKLWNLTDKDYEDNKQRELDLLV